MQRTTGLTEIQTVSNRFTHTDLCTRRMDTGLKSTVVNRALPSLQHESHVKFRL